MKEKLSGALMALCPATFAAATLGLAVGAEPFHTYYFLFAWWSWILFADAWLYRKGGESLFIGKPADFAFFLVPLSAVLWFAFEAFNLRLQNWVYLGVPIETWIRWPGYFLAFGTVLPAVFGAANLLDHYGIFRRNEFSVFFSEPPSRAFMAGCMSAGAAMLILPLIWPVYFFPLVWGGFALLLDPVNAAWGGKSLVQEWRQKNWNRTLQLLLAGLICGGLWEFWNYWAGAKWVYTVPLPERLLNELKLFEMPVVGFLGFPPFALECFAMAEFARGVRERVSSAVWRALAGAGLLFALAMCYAIDAGTVIFFR